MMDACAALMLLFLFTIVGVPANCQTLSPIITSEQVTSEGSNIELHTNVTVTDRNAYPITLDWVYNHTKMWNLLLNGNSVQSSCLLTSGCARYPMQTDVDASSMSSVVVSITLKIRNVQKSDDNIEVGIVHQQTSQFVTLDVQESQFVAADIVFGLDESGSIAGIDFKRQLNWVINLLGNFKDEIDLGQVRVGIILFNHRARTAIPLGRNAFVTLREQISNITQRSGGTNIEAAINACRVELEGSGRQVAKEMIILTDGESSGNILGAAMQARMSRITTVAVGVGSNTRSITLLNIAGESSRVFTVSNFNNLDRLTITLTTVIMVSATQKPNPPPAVVADIVFGLDESGSIGISDFGAQLTWVTDFLQTFKKEIDSNDVWVGIILFNSVSRTAIPLGSNSYEELNEKISNIRQRNGGTNIKAAIDACRVELEGSGRQVAKEMIIVTDGDSAGNILGAAMKARNVGIATVAVGAGSSTRRSTLLNIAGDASRVFEVSDFTKLQQVTTGLREMISQFSATKLVV